MLEGRPLRLSLSACFSACLSACLIAAAGCSFDAKYRHQTLRAASTEVRLEYRAHPGDRIQVSFMRSLSDSFPQDYRLQMGDEVQVNVQDREDLGRLAAVAPDGKIYFPYLEPLPASGKTLKELQSIAEEKYLPMAKSARVTLVPVRFAGKIDAVLQGLTGPGRGPEYATHIALDGNAVFPQIGFLKTAGLSLQQLNAALREAYRPILPGVEITANLSPGSSRLITLLGELRRPGSFPIEGSVSLAAALGLSEGWLPSAHLEDIILVQKRDGQIAISKFDLGKDLMAASQIQLVGGDVVFVPRSAITDLNVFVDQYLRRNLPFSVGVSVQPAFLTAP